MNSWVSRVLLAASIVPAAIQGATAAEMENAAFVGANMFTEAAGGFRTMLAAQKAADGGRQRILDKKLREAVASRNIAEMRRLAGLGADPNSYDGSALPPLAGAMIDHGDPEVVGALLDLGARADFKGPCDMTALHYAASYGRKNAAELLVAQHAVVDAKSCSGETPLVDAARDAKKDVFAYLLGLGADPNATDGAGKTPILLAANMLFFPDSRDILAFLLGDRRTDVNSRDKDGMTALKFAVKGNSAETVKLLLQASGIDVNDNGGEVTALFLAEVNGYEEIAQLLRTAGARGTPRVGMTTKLDGPLRLAAEPVGSDELDRRFSNTLDVDVQLDLNGDRTRVGAKAWICDPLMPHQPDGPPVNCQEIDYHFPQLRYDAASKGVFLGQRLVARDRGYWGGIKMEKGLKLDYNVIRRRVDNGADLKWTEAMEVSIIEKTMR